MLVAGCAGGSNLQPKNSDVAVIIKGSDSDFWNEVKSGAFSAATEYNIDITFEGPDNEEDYESQNKMIEKAVSKNVGAIVLSAIDYEKNASSVQKAIDKGIKVITVDSDVNVSGKELFIGTDNVSAGKKAAKRAVTLCENQKSVNIGIVNYGENTENGQQRLKGFKDYISKVEKMFEGTKVKKVNTMNLEGKSKRRGLVVGKTAKSKKAIVWLTEDSKDIEIFAGL